MGTFFAAGVLSGAVRALVPRHFVQERDLAG